MTAEGVAILFVVVAVGVAVGALVIHEARQRRRDAVLIGLLSSFGPAVVEGKRDPHSLVAWAEVARTARLVFPDAFCRLDNAAGGRFPFSPTSIDAAHARWTADWLAWERQHDLEYKNRANQAEGDVLATDREGSEELRSRLAAITQEKLQTYQDRYEHYVRVGKAIAALAESSDTERDAPRPST